MGDTQFTKLKGATLATFIGVARYAYVGKPDESKYGKNRYRLTLVARSSDDPAVKEFGRKLKALAKLHCAEISVNLKDEQYPVKLVDEKMSKGKDGKSGTGDAVGLPFIKMESNSSWTDKKGETHDITIPVLDAAGKPTDKQVYQGDIVKVEVRVVGWELDGDHGLKLMLNAVKLLKSNWTGGAGSTLGGIDEEFLDDDEGDESEKGSTLDDDDGLDDDEDGDVSDDGDVEDDTDPDTEEEDTDPIGDLV